MLNGTVLLDSFILSGILSEFLEDPMANIFAAMLVAAGNVFFGQLFEQHRNGGQMQNV